jgi:hypothetical protein
MSRRRRKALCVRDLAQTEATLGTVAKQTVVLARHPSVAGVISTVGVAVAYFFAARLSLALLGRSMALPYFGPQREWLQGF